jgi:dihydroorotate dehydrogenase (NAD+) catalytic subunit
MSAPGSVDLSVQIGPLHLTNPVLAASGTFGYGIEFAELVDLNRLGGFVTKGLSLKPMLGAPPPRLCETPSGMLNAVGLQNVGVEAFVKDKLPLLREFRTHVVANIFGETISEYAEVVRHLDGAEGVSAYELNVSCPNTDAGGMLFGCDPGQTAKVVAATRSVTKKPLWVKMTPNVTDIRIIVRAAEEAGADAFTVANTYPAMSVDYKTRRSRLGRPTGGLSGPAIRPISVRLVSEAAGVTKLPIIGLGGIESGEDVLEYLVVGATATQVGTASFTDPRACERIIDDLFGLCSASNISTINSLRGTLVRELD